MLTKQRAARLRKKIIASRSRLLAQRPFFALLLMYMEFCATKEIKTITTDGRTIYFSPDYIDKLYDDELDFLLCHQIMHIIFGDLWRSSKLEGETYHHACDIVVNYNLQKYGWEKKRYPHLGEVYCKCPGCDVEEMTAKEVFEELPYSLEVFDERTKSKFLIDSDAWWSRKEKAPYSEVVEPALNGRGGDGTEEGMGKSDAGDRQELLREWKSRVEMIDTYSKQGVGKIPKLSKRRLKKMYKSYVDWKALLNEFIQEEICDYSFVPPDRRFSDADFFLPDYNDKEDSVKNVLFMIDTSGSMDEKMVSEVYNEVVGAVEQFGGKLSGWLGFFDVAVAAPLPFESVEELKNIKPKGGGGTSFEEIFKYVDEHMRDMDLSSIIILTDGFCEYPEEKAAGGIPVMWILNNEEADPPWGRVMRIKSKA